VLEGDDNCCAIGLCVLEGDDNCCAIGLCVLEGDGTTDEICVLGLCVLGLCAPIECNMLSILEFIT